MKIFRSLINYGLAAILLASPINVYAQNKKQESYSLMSKVECAAASKPYLDDRIQLFDGLVYDETARKVCVYNTHKLKEDIEKEKKHYSKLTGEAYTDSLEVISDSDFRSAYRAITGPGYLQAIERLKRECEQDTKHCKPITISALYSVFNTVEKESITPILLSPMFRDVGNTRVLIPDINGDNTITAEDAELYKAQQSKTKK